MPSAAPDIRDIKPLVEFPHGGWGAGWWALAFVAVVAVAVAVAVLFWLRRHRRARPVPVVPPRPAGEVALERLAALWADLEGDRIDARAYFYGVSQAVRAYVEARFGVNATDLTTLEIRARLVKSAELSSAQGSELVGLLELADLVKFAKAEAQPGLRQEARARARRFVEGTAPAPAPAGGTAATAEGR